MAFNLTLTFIGCGNMGSAILSGVLDASTSPEIPCPFNRIIACTKTQKSAETLAARYKGHKSPIELSYLADSNSTAASQSDVIILGCKPYLVDAVLAEPGLADALAGRLVISIIAGKTIEVLSETISKNKSQNSSTAAVVARAIPNVAASIRESMTVIELPAAPSPTKEHSDIITWIFSRIGQTKIISPDLFDCGSMLMASIATMSVAVDGILDGCVAEGMKRSEANEMTAQCLLGLAKLLQEGHHPAVLRESISSPRGCTIQGLLAVEKAGVRSAFADSVIAGTQHLKKLQGKE
ncbi:hypothetical protein BDW74DRAFT_150220 [Aspergillus multicolor]|uniref:pyrroline-5-carboxylate reductase family protein n=1 Tax=Aspergillus multicolor TaxID=41759 RepID=UPI003CCE1C76